VWREVLGYDGVFGLVATSVRYFVMLWCHVMCFLQWTYLHDIGQGRPPKHSPARTPRDLVGNKCRTGVPVNRAEVMCSHPSGEAAHFRDAQILTQSIGSEGKSCGQRGCKCPLACGPCTCGSLAIFGWLEPWLRLTAIGMSTLPEAPQKRLPYTPWYGEFISCT
jgi:hypothetical protein